MPHCQQAHLHILGLSSLKRGQSIPLQVVRGFLVSSVFLYGAYWSFGILSRPDLWCTISIICWNDAFPLWALLSFSNFNWASLIITQMRMGSSGVVSHVAFWLYCPISSIAQQQAKKCHSKMGDSFWKLVGPESKRSVHHGSFLVPQTNESVCVWRGEEWLTEMYSSVRLAGFRGSKGCAWAMVYWTASKACCCKGPYLKLLCWSPWLKEPKRTSMWDTCYFHYPGRLTSSPFY